MAISPFSVQHDYEVQEYNKLRRTYLANERRRRAEAKTMEKAFEKDRRMSLQSTIRMLKSRTWILVKLNFTNISAGNTGQEIPVLKQVRLLGVWGCRQFSESCQ